MLMLRVQWGGRKSRDKYEHILEDLYMNAQEQWREGNDLHVDTLDVYLIEVSILVHMFMF